MKPETVKLAYQLILGREPENDAVVKEKAGAIESLDELRRDLVDSEEFRSTVAGSFSVCLSGSEPRLPIDTLATISQETLEVLFERVSATWSDLGCDEPFWSVWTDDRFRQDAIDEHRELFFASGDIHLKMLSDTLERNGVNPANIGLCLEVGCGVGRFTRALAKISKHVHAIDVSAAHLKIAEMVLLQENVTNVSLDIIKNPRQFHALPAVDFVYSAVVLQHNPPPLIEWMISGMLSSLNSGGFAVFQVPTYLSGYEFKVDDYLKRPRSQDELEMHAISQNHVFRILEQHNCRVLEVLEDAWTFPKKGDRSNTFVVEKRIN